MIIQLKLLCYLVEKDEFWHIWAVDQNRTITISVVVTRRCKEKLMMKKIQKLGERRMRWRLLKNFVDYEMSTESRGSVLSRLKYLAPSLNSSVITDQEIHKSWRVKGQKCDIFIIVISQARKAGTATIYIYTYFWRLGTFSSTIHYTLY